MDFNRERVLEPLFLSDGFKDILMRIQEKGNSNISKKFLDRENDGKHTYDVTYIDRTDNDDRVTYIQSARLKRSGGGNGFHIKGRTETTIGRLVRRLFGTIFNQSSIEKFVNKYKAIVRDRKSVV